MKNLLITIGILLFTAIGFSQTIRIANSNPGAATGVNTFTGSTAINLAIAASANGDIIYVVPSSVVYSPPQLNGKGVSIFGGGFNPDKPGAVRSTLSGVYLNASNVRLSGLVITSDINIPGAFNNIMIDKCRMGNLGDGSGGAAKGNLIIQDCIIGEYGQSGGAAVYVGIGSSGVRLSNNIIYVPAVNGTGIDRLNGAIIENNIIIGNASGGSVPVFRDVTNCNIKNNIFYGVRTNVTSATFTGNVQQHNISYDGSDNTFSTINGNTSFNNIIGQNPLFTNFPYSTSYNFSYDAHLQSTSPAKSNGLGGIDMGIYSGPTPFDPFGTSLPIVQSITTSGTVIQGTNMSVQVKAKGN
jgi:hypothetical protein